MAAVVLLPSGGPSSRPLTPPPSAEDETAPRISINSSLQADGLSGTAPVPNKHTPYCSPGPRPSSNYGIPSPPSSPPKDFGIPPTSPLHPPDPRSRLHGTNPPVYGISATTVAEAVERIATKSLPDPKQVFPWLHGLHAENQLQLGFFDQRRRHLHNIPTCLRGLTIVKAGGDLALAKLKGSIAPQELLTTAGTSRRFHDIDPKAGFSVRNFQIQACKMATVSDIIVYGDDDTSRSEVEKLAQVLAQAQKTFSEEQGSSHHRVGAPSFNTFMVVDPFSTFEEYHPNLVVISSSGSTTGRVLDFLRQERLEMHSMSKPSEIANNVWLGATPDVETFGYEVLATELARFNILIEGSDSAQMPSARALADVETCLRDGRNQRVVTQLDFPGSGSVYSWPMSKSDADGLMRILHWIYKMANPQPGNALNRIFLHCTDGYTETSLLSLAYLMFAECIPAHEAWIKMHCIKKRNFFAYTSDKVILESLEPRIMQESPLRPDVTAPLEKRPDWAAQMDGSLPSRILPYLYLGNLTHASNPGMLRELGISRVLSVGEPIKWDEEDIDDWGASNLLYIDKVQDNGVDPLANDLKRCLKFIEKGKRAGDATLVHCRVGVSRSATICIAEAMKEKSLSFPRAYCFVRARRLNVIIQPHLLFVYELLKWEEEQCEVRGQQPRRELEWATVAREIALMNKPYCR